MRRGDKVRNYLIAAFMMGLVSVSASTAFAFACPTAPNLPSADGSQPPNLGVLKLQLIDYKCFGAYDRDIAKVLAEAMSYVDERSRRMAPGEQLALVLDVDETSISNWVNLSTDDFGFFLGGECTLQPKEPCGFDRWIATQTPDVIQPTLDLFTVAKAKGVTPRARQSRQLDTRSSPMWVTRRVIFRAAMRSVPSRYQIRSILSPDLYLRLRQAASTEIKREDIAQPAFA